MFAYIVRRVVIGVILLIVMSFVTFMLFFASSVDPGRFACGKSCSPQLIEQVDKAFGYNKPWPVQWEEFMVGVVKGRQYPEDESIRKANPNLVTDCSAPCLGYSVVNYQLVWTELRQAIPVTASVALVAFILWIVGGVALGCIAALTKGSFIDRGVVGLSLVAYSFPSFFIGLFLLLYVSIKWQLLPVPSYVPLTQNPAQWLLNLILPGVTLALVYMAGYVRITRAFVLESMGEDYLRTARAKGLKGTPILLKHTLRAALTPIVTMAGLDLAGLLGGAVIAERVFNFNGLGGITVNAVTNYDLPTQVGVVLLAGTFFIVANIVVDVLYAAIDPRVRVA